MTAVGERAIGESGRGEIVGGGRSGTPEQQREPKNLERKRLKIIKKRAFCDFKQWKEQCTEAIGNVRRGRGLNEKPLVEGANKALGQR
jgi:hypothetical protein